VSETLKLPAAIKACLFDLDGVLTQTAKVHAAAWKEMFDGYLRERAQETSGAFAEFTDADYIKYVDGRPRYDGVRQFLQSRDVEPEERLVRELGDRKNALVLRLIEEQGVEVYEGSVRFVRLAREHGLRTAVVSSSANTLAILRSVGIEDLFEARVDGVIAEERKLPGKPAPDTFLEGARELGVDRREAAVFEDALAGVEAGRAGDFGWVIGVDRADQADDLRSRGADVVVQDLGELIEAS
jgi:beta-phosphoglucomutase family hydrolase